MIGLRDIVILGSEDVSSAACQRQKTKPEFSLRSLKMPTQLHVKRSAALSGVCRVPGDKSISHRALMFGAIAQGKSRVAHFLNGSDCLATAGVMRDLGVQITTDDSSTLVIEGRGLQGLCEPKNVLDCENSGTTIRLMSGLLSGQKFLSVLTGSEQIRRRPMGRVIVPLKKMGAQIWARENDRLAPIALRQSPGLHGTTHQLEVASAQVKSALLLAGLYAEAPTTIVQPGPSRDHSSRLLRAMGAQIKFDGRSVEIAPQQKPLAPFDMRVPGDASSAAFLMAAALIVPDSQLLLSGVSVNETRTGFLEAVKQMGAAVEVHHRRELLNEPIADVTIRFEALKAAHFFGEIIVRMIDELPILAVVATQAHGETVIRDAKELTVKETNRIETTVSELRKMGAKIEAREDGFVIEGPTPLKGALVSSHGDHRLAMAMAIAGLCADGETVVDGAEVTVDSFPGFAPMLRTLGADIA
jgi:3-phosphoshikimate 1-carboxyvinyltransferase